MSFARFSYTAVATIWKALPRDEDGDRSGYLAPVHIMCDYSGDRMSRKDALGLGFPVKNTFWTEYSLADQGDYILIGSSNEVDPIAAGADEIMRVIRYADTFERQFDDYAIMTAG